MGEDELVVGVSLDERGWPVFRLSQMEDTERETVEQYRQRIEAALTSFTPEDVSALRTIALNLGPGAVYGIHGPTLASIADRLEALLPPEERAGHTP